ncbi:MAG: transpeptidase family protein [Treponema sp.]|nr:transpeptidase family protein [Treponema sp.]
MNSFFKPIQTIIIGICALCFALVVIITYGKIAFEPENQIVQKSSSVERGSIVDRNGKPLAVQTHFYHLGVSPTVIKNPDKLVHDIAPILSLTPEDEADMIKKIQESTSRFIYIRKKLDQATYDELSKIISDGKYTGVRFDTIPGRVYPENSLASQIIGYMGDDGKGLSGVEYSMQNTLSPNPKLGNQNTTHGQNVYVTLDANLQYKLEKIAHNAMETTQAASMMLIAANAKNGEILSYISFPSADLNNFSNASSEERRDRPAMDAYEPGSVFKIFTVATLIEMGGISPNDSFYCDGIYEKKAGNENIRIKCLEHHGWVTAREALKYSCNDALAQISDKIDAETFLARIHAMGFGSRTDIELPGETTGLVKSTSDKLWSARSKPTMAMGQEISVSALQMVHAATAIANGGIPIKLSIIHKLATYDGKDTFIHTPVFENRLFKQTTANYILSCMETTAESGTGHRAQLGDISIGVKTGTAQMADPVHGGYSDTDFLSNCLAIFPIEDPEIILYIVIEKAQGETYAGRIVAPVIAEAADTIIDHLGMNRGSATSLAHSGHISIKSNTPIKIGSDLPDFTGMSKRDLLPLLDRTDINIIINGNGWVNNQTPPAGTPITENMTIELNLE